MSQRRPPRSRAPISTASNGSLGVIIAVIALALGFLVLRDVRADGGSSGGINNGSTDSSAPVDTGAGATTTSFPLDIGGFTIQVVNASGVAGSAGKMTLDLQALNFVVRQAVNAAPGTAKRAKTGVFHLTGCESAAQRVNQVLGGNAEVGPMPSPIPTETGTLAEACVLIMLGTDLAGKALQGVAGGNGAAVTTTAPPAMTTTTSG